MEEASITIPDDTDNSLGCCFEGKDLFRTAREKDKLSQVRNESLAD